MLYAHSTASKSIRGVDAECIAHAFGRGGVGGPCIGTPLETGNMFPTSGEMDDKRHLYI